MPDTGSSDMQIRAATLDDVIGIVYVQATTWINTYPSQENGISEADIRSVDFKGKIINWQHLIRSPNYQVWVAANEDKVVGFIAVLKETDMAEIYEHCVLPDYQERGLATKLWDQAAEWIGDLPVKARIISYYQAGAEFYKGLGFTVSTLGEVDFITLPSGKNIPTIEMRRGDLPIRAKNPAPQEQAGAGGYTDTRAETPPAPEVPQTNVDAGPKLVGRAELSKISDVRPSTIKYYTEVGILPFEQAEARLARRYDKQQALRRLEEIQQLRAQGLSIQQIAERLQ